MCVFYVFFIGISAMYPFQLNSWEVLASTTLWVQAVVTIVYPFSSIWVLASLLDRVHEFSLSIDRRFFSNLLAHALKHLGAWQKGTASSLVWFFGPPRLKC